MRSAILGPTVDQFHHSTVVVERCAAAEVGDGGEDVVHRYTFARDAFKAGDYNKALDQVNQAIREMPNESALHEFRGVTLFALGRYTDAAAPLYAVLAVGPGWDWGTFIGLYPNVTVYTEQLRALESYCNLNPQSASARHVSCVGEGPGASPASGEDATTTSSGAGAAGVGAVGAEHPIANVTVNATSARITG